MTSPGDGVQDEVLVGLLLAHGPNRMLPFGSHTPFAERLCMLADRAGVRVIGFGPADLDLKRGRVLAGHFTGPVSGWRWEEGSLPEVVWNRYYGQDRWQIGAALTARGVSLINEGSLDKWKAHQMLSLDDGLRSLLPETALVTDAGVVLAMSERHPILFLKPLAGSVGRGIICCRRERGGSLHIQYVSSKTGGYREVTIQPLQLDQWLERKGKRGRLIAQQGLDLTIFHGRPADIRVLVQKGLSGRWRVTGIGARVAAHGRFTANLHTGGSAVPLALLAEAAYPTDAAAREALGPRLETLSLQVAHRVEQNVGTMGELGLDFGLDRNGRLWYIEQNAQPGRSIFEQLGDGEVSEQAHLRPLHYAKYLVRLHSKTAGRAEAT